MTDQPPTAKPRRKAGGSAKPRKPRAKPRVDAAQLPLPDPAPPVTKAKTPRAKTARAKNTVDATATAVPRPAIRPRRAESDEEPEFRIDPMQIWRFIRPRLTPSRLTLLILLLTAAAFAGVLSQSR